MGRIKSLMVKRTAKQILAKDAKDFNESFENNKKILGSNMPSKSIRNKIAGYMARLQRMKKEAALEAAKPKPVKVESADEPLQADVY